MFVAEQQPDGRWIDHEDYFPTTCFALMFLTRSLPKPMQPDLGAINRSLRYSPPSPRVGDPVRISVTLANTGAPIEVDGSSGFLRRDPQHKVGKRSILKRCSLTRISMKRLPESIGPQVRTVIIRSMLLLIQTQRLQDLEPQ